MDAALLFIRHYYILSTFVFHILYYYTVYIYIYIFSFFSQLYVKMQHPQFFFA